MELRRLLPTSFLRLAIGQSACVGGEAVEHRALGIEHWVATCMSRIEHHIGVHSNVPVYESGYFCSNSPAIEYMYVQLTMCAHIRVFKLLHFADACHCYCTQLPMYMG